MNDDELRSLIRAAVQRHVGETVRPKPDPTRDPGLTRAEIPSVLSFGQYRIERSADDTMCIIEPAVQCNHCGFCRCHGH